MDVALGRASQELDLVDVALGRASQELDLVDAALGRASQELDPGKELNGSVGRAALGGGGAS
ncbi:hypothetical protein FACS1894122_00880 [Alphaproteobacteria bacterium]|nr:hypothetical protein FACS1894122_00880 [Alphaproteobacteria bacterium]